MNMTSAYANKLLRKFTEEKDYWVEKERTSCLYTAATNEDAVIPEYDYVEVANTIEELNRKICVIKHAINMNNVHAEIDVDGECMSVDEILVTMAQKNARKNMLDFMRKQQPKTRKEGQYFGNRAPQPEYQYINYDLELVKKEYDSISLEIMQLQMALDKYNQTVEFEVSI